MATNQHDPTEARDRAAEARMREAHRARRAAESQHDCYLCRVREAEVTIREEATAQVVDACARCADMIHGHGIARMPMTIADVRAWWAGPADPRHAWAAQWIDQEATR